MVVAKHRKRTASKSAPAERREHERPRERSRIASLARPIAIVVALALIAFANTLRNGFTLDDIPIVAENPVTRSMANLPTVFATNYWSRGGTEVIGDPTLYRPLTVSTYALDYAVWGLSPVGYHATNVVLHAVTSVVVLLVGVEVLGATAAAVAAASIFAVHPVHTEAVAGIVGRAEILATLFVLLAFLVMRRRANGGVRDTRAGNAMRATALGGLLYLLGLFSKESAVTLPALIALDDWLGRPVVPDGDRTPSATSALRYGALAVALAIYLAFRQYAVSGPPHLWPGFAGVSAGERILTASRVMLEYVGLFVFPRTLQADYWKTDVPIASLGDPLALLSVAVWIAVAVFVFRFRRREPALVLAIAWFFITIAPVSNLAFPIGVAKAERLLYLPSVGLCLAVGWAYERVARRVAVNRLPNAALAVIVIALGLRAVVRNRDWRDNYTLATATLRVSPSSPLMSDLAAEALARSGDMNRALALLQEAVRQAPEMPLIRTHLGLVYYGMGRFDDAIAAYRESIRQHPSEAEAYNNLGVAYARVGQRERAAEAYREALRLKPDYAAPRDNLERLNSAAPPASGPTAPPVKQP